MADDYGGSEIDINEAEDFNDVEDEFSDDSQRSADYESEHDANG